MNIRFVTVVIFILIILGGLGIFFMNEQNTKELTERITPTGQLSQEDQNVLTTVTSSDSRVSFMYPSKWMSTDTTTTNQKGEFGPIKQSWSIHNAMVSSPKTATLPENIATVLVEIEGGGSNLSIDDLVACSMKTITCEKVGIDNEQFIRAESVLNTGVTMITVATFYDDNVLKATATITPGSDRESLVNSVNAMLTSFKFSSPQADN